MHLNSDDIRRVAQTGTAVAWCPTSNLRLGSGIAPVGELIEAGAAVGLAVDGSASNDAGHMLAEVRQAMLLARARGIIQMHPAPHLPRPGATALFIAGHGTGNNENSRRAIERQVDLIRARSIYAEVHAVFMEEDPRVGDCYGLACANNIVMVPFFISDGLHSYEDIPVMLGEPEPEVRDRLNRGQPTWRNPTEKNGKLVWYTRAIGSEPHLADVILERVREAARGEERSRQIRG